MTPVLSFDDRIAAFDIVGERLSSGGRLAITYMPRASGASAAAADAFAGTVAAELSAAEFRCVTMARLPLSPVPAVAVLGSRGCG